MQERSTIPDPDPVSQPTPAELSEVIMEKYFEVWECPECGLAEKFNRPRLKVEHDCIGDGTQHQHTVQLVKITPEESRGAITIPEDAPYKPEDY